MTDVLTRKLMQLAPISVEQERAVLGAISRTISLGPDEDILREGGHPSSCHVLLEGFACRYKLLPRGKRQITSFALPGDFCDLDGFISGRMDYSVGSLSPCTLGLIPHTALSTLIEDHPVLSQVLWRDTVLEGSIAREWVVNVGRRSAKRRIAHVLCEVLTRLRAVGLAGESGFEWPLTQPELGDATALTSVHVSRVLGELRREGVVTIQGRAVTVHDWDRLRATGGFDEDYLVVRSKIQV